MKKTLTAILALVALSCQKEAGTTSIPLNQLSSNSSENLVQPLPDEIVPDGPMTITQERNLYIGAKDDILNVNVKNPYAVPLTTRNYLWKQAIMLGSGVSTLLATPGETLI